MISKTSEVYRQTKQHCQLLQTGTVLSIDPSMGSMSSLPGWAVYKAGNFYERGCMDVPREGDHTVRLMEVRLATVGLITYFRPDVIVVENLPVMAKGFRSQVSHASLLMARGVILSCIGHTPWVSIMPMSWKKMVRETYVKGDAEDAEEIGYVVIELAKQIAESDPPRRYGSKRKSGRKKAASVRARCRTSKSIRKRNGK